jgi:serine/threonine protein kinase
VAIKLYLDPSHDERVQREIRAMSQIRHRALANLLEFGSADIEGYRYQYLIWEFIDGRPLDGHIGLGPVDASVVALMGRDVTTAVEAIWSRRIVHRDINPRNIMMRTSGGAVLIDLGVAKYIDQTPLTAPGSTWGTAGYMSPEQLLGLELTCQSDIFSLGITLQHALAGRHPSNLDQQRLVRAGGPMTASVAPAAPALLAAVIDRMVSRRPAHRPSLRALVDYFDEVTRRL